MDYVAIDIKKTANGKNPVGLQFLSERGIIPGLRWNARSDHVDRLEEGFTSLCMHVATPFGKAKDHPRAQWVSPEDERGHHKAIALLALGLGDRWSEKALDKVKYVFIDHETEGWAGGGPLIVKALTSLWMLLKARCPNAVVTYYNQGQKITPEGFRFPYVPFGVPKVLNQCSLFGSLHSDEDIVITSTEPTEGGGDLAVNVNLFRYWDLGWRPREKRRYLPYGPSNTPNWLKGKLIAKHQRLIRTVLLYEVVPPWEVTLPEEFGDRFEAFQTGVEST